MVLCICPTSHCRAKKDNADSKLCAVALSMADGYARASGKPQCVIIHVDVGTQGLGAAVHNASCGRAPVLIFAGLSPYTCEGELRGSRTEYIHWIQDVPDQKEIIKQYCRYTGEIKRGVNVKQMVGRALQFATSAPMGPAYLVGSREAMEEEIPEYSLKIEHWGPVGPAALPESAVKMIAEALVDACEPLLITGYAGRNHQAVSELVALAETVKGMRILDTGGSDMCFPGDHRASVGLRYGVEGCIKSADVILMIDVDVPWIPTQCRPKESTRVFHLDADPMKQQMPIAYYPAEARYKADAYTSVKQIHEYINSTPALKKKVTTYTDRWEKLKEIHSKRMETIRSLAQPGKDESQYNVSYLCAAVRKAVPADTVFAIEAVTNTAFVADQILPTIPGTWINCGGGGLGWNAPKNSLKLVHPNGVGAKATNEELNISFVPSPDYAGIAKAAAGHNLWAGHASTVQELHEQLPKAIESVKNGIGAVLDAHLDGPQGKYGGGKAALVG
ncbi:hypothetical protein P7C71_g958, partial [Lecanoromycetidae sp. Uapishka_2]